MIIGEPSLFMERVDDLSRAMHQNILNPSSGQSLFVNLPSGFAEKVLNSYITPPFTNPFISNPWNFATLLQNPPPLPSENNDCSIGDWSLVITGVGDEEKLVRMTKCLASLTWRWDSKQSFVPRKGTMRSWTKDFWERKIFYLQAFSPNSGHKKMTGLLSHRSAAVNSMNLIQDWLLCETTHRHKKETRMLSRFWKTMWEQWRGYHQFVFNG